MRTNLPIPPEPKFTDDAGRQWYVFAIQYRHEIDDMTLSAYILAIDHAHAEEQLEFIRANGYVSANVSGYFRKEGTK